MLAIELTDAWRSALLTCGRIALILVIAAIVNVIVRRAIRRLGLRMRKAADEVRGRAPNVLVRGERAQRADARANTLTSVASSAFSVAIGVITVLMVLSELEINLGPLVAGAGVASIAIGFGAQSIVRDVLAGFFVILEDQYGVGDIIDAGVASGEVEHLSLRATRLRDLSGTVWHIPNGSIISVGNKSQNWARAVIEVIVSHGADIRAARSVMREVAEGLAADETWAARLAGTVDEQGVQAVGPEGVTLRVVVDTEPASQWAVERELRMRIKEAFDEAGIEMSIFVLPPQPPGGRR